MNARGPIERTTYERNIQVAIALASVIEGSFTSGYMAYFIQSTGSIAAADAVASWFWWTMVIAEMPTGYLADLWGPRVALLTSAAVRSVGFLLFFIANGSTLTLNVANMVAAAAVTLSSGTFAAQLKLSARDNNAVADFSRFAATATMNRNIGLFGGAVASFAAMRWFGLKWIWILAICATFVLLVFVYTTWKNTKGVAERHMFKQLRGALITVFGSPLLVFWLCIDATLVFSSMSMFDNWVAVYAPQLGFQAERLVAGTLLIYLFRSLVGKLWSKKRVDIPAHLLLFAFGIASIGAGVTGLFGSIPFFLAGVLAATALTIVITERVTSALPLDQANSVASFQSLVQNVCGALALTFLSVLLLHFNVQTTWRIGGALSIAAALAIWLSPRILRVQARV